MSHVLLRKPTTSASRQRKPSSDWRYHDLTRLSAPRVLAQLEIGKVNDPLEREADAVADRVMRAPAAAVSPDVTPRDAGRAELQRACASCEAEAEDEPPDGSLRRAAETSVASAPTTHGGTRGLPSMMNAGIQSARFGGGQGLDAETRAFMEPRFGRDLGDVRVHAGAEAAKFSAAVQAKAFTVGNDIFFAKNQFRPENASGRHLLAHEITHTLQQRDGAEMSLQRKIDFEFDINYGMEKKPDPSPHPDHAVDTDTALTDHDKEKDGFKVIADGNRIEIATDRFGLEADGEVKMEKAISNMMAFTQEIEDECDKTPAVPIIDPDSGKVDKDFEKGKPTWHHRFKPPFHALPLNRKRSLYYRKSCHLDGAPQATLDAPLESVSKLVGVIEKSKGKGAGKALTGNDDDRAGVRSDALFHARDTVVAERKRQLKDGLTLSDGSKVSESNFSQRLEGFMILVVSYLRTSEEKTDKRDYEVFSKAYPPIVLHTRFRQLFSDVLSQAERNVFIELYGAPSVRDNLYKLARRKRAVNDDTLMFPERTHEHEQDQTFGKNKTPTWGVFIDKIINNKPLNDQFGQEVNFTPLAKFEDKPQKAGPKNVPGKNGLERARIGAKLELRRIGWTWVSKDDWPDLMRNMLKITRELNE